MPSTVIFNVGSSSRVITSFLLRNTIFYRSTISDSLQFALRAHGPLRRANYISEATAVVVCSAVVGGSRVPGDKIRVGWGQRRASQRPVLFCRFLLRIFPETLLPTAWAIYCCLLLYTSTYFYNIYIYIYIYIYYGHTRTKMMWFATRRVVYSSR